jgi:hypothetical protein
MFVERYSHVMHIVSTIEGKLKPELTAVDALRACFPAGTLSGAPKVRAMEIIEELEPARRGTYGGAVLYADFSGNLDSCIAIRSMLHWRQRLCAGRRGHRGRFRARARVPGVDQQGAGCDSRHRAQERFNRNIPSTALHSCISLKTGAGRLAWSETRVAKTNRKESSVRGAAGGSS